MKRIITIAILSLLCLPIFANEVSSIWTRLYSQARTLEQKQSIMQNIVEQNDRNMVPVLVTALDDLLRQERNITTTQERAAFNNLLRMIIREIGNLRAKEAEDLVFRVFNETNDGFIKMESILTLGRVGARKYGDWLVLYLRNMNLGIFEFDSTPINESLVSALVEALERLRLETGFRPVFHVSVGRFSRENKVKAERAMLNMIEDPTEILLEIMLTEDTFENKLVALEIASQSSANIENKERIATEALRITLDTAVRDPRQQNFLSRMRIFAINMLTENNFSSSRAIDYLDRIVREGYVSQRNFDEALPALKALGNNRSEEAVDTLIQFLEIQNNRQREGFLSADTRLVIATIQALGKAGSTTANYELRMVPLSNWGGGVNREARQALEAIDAAN